MCKIRKVTIIGAGFMGCGIAQVTAEAGFNVCLYDLNDEIIENGISSVHQRWARKVKVGKLKKEIEEEYRKFLVGCADLETAVSESDLVIEAIAENFSAKSKLFKQISGYCKPECVFASNTSSLSITALAAMSERPQKFVGTHFFSPVPVMKLLEVIPGMQTDVETTQLVQAFGEKIGKICVTSKDSHGFLVNRLLDPMLNEAIQMLDDGVGTIADIDTAMKYGCGHPMGPFELLDMAGIDVEYAVMQVFYRDTGNPKYSPAPLLKKMVESGYLGKKTGKGFYIYKSDGSKKINPIFAAGKKE